MGQRAVQCKSMTFAREAMRPIAAALRWWAQACRSRALAFVWIILCALLAVQDGLAQDATDGSSAAYPRRPVRLVVPYAPGGGLDILARMLAQRLTERWGQGVVVDNRPGASGMVGAQQVSKAVPDGYTLIIVATEHITAPRVYHRHLYEPVADFAPISQVSAQSYLLVVHPSLPVHSVAEFISYVKVSGRSFLYTSAGTGGVGHLSGEMFKAMADTQMTHVPYKGTGQAVNDTVGGQVLAMFSNPLAVVPHVKSGRLRLLATTGPQRIASLPDTPTIAESGLNGFATLGWNGILAPAGTPVAIVRIIARAVSEIVRAPEMRDRIAGDGAEPVGGTPEEFTERMTIDELRWAGIIANMKIDPE